MARALCRFDDAEWKSAGALFAVHFDPADPSATPHTLAAVPDDGQDPITVAVAAARRRARAGGVAIDAPLGEVQWAMRGERRIAVHGGGEAEGCSTCSPPSVRSRPAPGTAAGSGDPLIPGHERTGLADGGYQVTYGTSFLMVVEMTPDGPTPRAARVRPER